MFILIIGTVWKGLEFKLILDQFIPDLGENDNHMIISATHFTTFQCHTAFSSHNCSQRFAKLQWNIKSRPKTVFYKLYKTVTQ